VASCSRRAPPKGGQVRRALRGAAWQAASRSRRRASPKSAQTGRRAHALVGRIGEGRRRPPFAFPAVERQLERRRARNVSHRSALEALAAERGAAPGVWRRVVGTSPGLAAFPRSATTLVGSNAEGPDCSDARGTRGPASVGHADGVDDGPRPSRSGGCAGRVRGETARNGRDAKTDREDAPRPATDEAIDRALKRRMREHAVTAGVTAGMS